MPSRSVKSTSTYRTVKTIDDVFSRLDDELDFSASLAESRSKIKSLVIDNPKLRQESIDNLESLISILGPISPNPSSIIKSMCTNNVILSGIQATSFFYPICSFSDAPWDFFCSSINGTGDKFILDMLQSSGVEQIEAVDSSDGNKVVYFRRNINGEKQPINIRVYISNEHPIQSALSQQMSYQQTIISATTAICFWPRLMKSRLYRSFDSNKSSFRFPIGKTKCIMSMEKLTATRLKKQLESPHIYKLTDREIEIVNFKNECDINEKLFKSRGSKMNNIVYAVSNDSTRYLGDIGGM